MNLYACKFVETPTFGDSEFCDVVLHIAADTRGRAKALLISYASDAGFEVDWTDPCSVKLLAKGVDLLEGEDRDYSWIRGNDLQC